LIPLVFYVVVAAAQLNIADLRDSGWVFEMVGGGKEEHWYKFYSYYGAFHPDRPISSY
jgi:SulP family sulfate permease